MDYSGRHEKVNQKRKKPKRRKRVEDALASESNTEASTVEEPDDGFDPEIVELKPGENDTDAG